MKLLAQQEITTPTPVKLGAIRTLAVREVSGVVKATFDGETVELAAGEVLELPPGLAFEEVTVTAEYGASATIIYGMLSFRSFGASTSTGGSSMAQVITDNYANPNGNVEPDDTDAGAIYYYDTAAPTVWTWSVANQAWIQVIA